VNGLTQSGGREKAAEDVERAGKRDLLARENEIRLHLLQSLAMSQRAISKMIATCAELPDYSEEMSRQVLRNLELLARAQGALAEKIGRHRLRGVMRGVPGRPWLSPDHFPPDRPERQTFP